MTSSYYIKAYYARPNQKSEIRRFTIDISPENDAYHDLQGKIAAFLPNNQLNDFVFHYKDEDDEDITFSSNSELRSAIALNKDTKTLKVYVKVHEPSPQPQQEDTTNKICHKGVQCDNCNGPVIGFRYKCFVCPNYDLCEKCSSTGVHSEHNMIRITKPGSFQYPHDFHYNHHHPHTAPPPPPPPPPPPAFVPSPEYLARIQHQIPHWLPTREHSAHVRTHIQQHLDSLKTNTQARMQNSKQYLENVGQYLQQVLSPFGIDCDYQVGESKSTTNQEQKSTTNDEQTSTVNQTQEQQQHQEAATVNTISTAEASAASQNTDLIQLNNDQEQTTNSTTSVSTKSTRIRTPLEKSIDDCMQRMTAMGFQDASGALRELIRSKEGDINAVLDAINSRPV